MTHGFPPVTLLIAPGLRGHVDQHWQTLLERRLPNACLVPPLACDWGSELVDLGHIGHLNPASGFGPRPGVDALLARVAQPL
jgi:predicted alpha/beta hydrolase family esterase